jgi:hypothetical protein
MSKTDLKSIIKELDAAFGKDFSKSHPELVLKYHQSKSIQAASEIIGESISMLGTKMELSNIRGGRGGAMAGMDFGMPGMGGMGMMNDFMDEDFKAGLDEKDFLEEEKDDIN